MKSYTYYLFGINYSIYDPSIPSDFAILPNYARDRCAVAPHELQAAVQH